MRIFLKQVVMTAFTALLLILAGHNSSAQTQQLPKPDNTVQELIAMKGLYYAMWRQQIGERHRREGNGLPEEKKQKELVKG